MSVKYYNLNRLKHIIKPCITFSIFLNKNVLKGPVIQFVKIQRAHFFNEGGSLHLHLVSQISGKLLDYDR